MTHEVVFPSWKPEDWLLITSKLSEGVQDWALEVSTYSEEHRKLASGLKFRIGSLRVENPPREGLDAESLKELNDTMTVAFLFEKASEDLVHNFAEAIRINQEKEQSKAA
jgi:hypothetical protein